MDNEAIDDRRDAVKSRLTRWVIFALVVLGVTIVCGQVMNAVIKPKRDDYAYMSTYVPPRQGQQYQPRDDLKAGPQLFHPSAPPAEATKSVMLAAIQAAQAAHANALAGKVAPDFPRHFHTSRMAEEWVRFGVQNLRGNVTTQFVLNGDDANIQSMLGTLATTPEPALVPATLAIEWVAPSADGNDTVALVKHTTTLNDVRKTWHGRWWLHQKWGEWKVYDFEMQPGRLRWNAVACARQVPSNGGDLSRTTSTDASLDDLIKLTDTAMTTGEWTPFRSSWPGTQLKWATPIHTVRTMALRMPVARQSTADHLKILRGDLAAWSDTPVGQLMIASLSGLKDDLDKFHSTFGAHPWADALEAAQLLKLKKSAEAKSLLEKSLTANPGQPLLLAALAAMDGVDFKQLAAQAALGGEPAAAMREVFRRRVTVRDGTRDFVTAYLEIRPEEPEARLAKAVILAADDDDFKQAATMLKALLNETPLQARAALANRFASLYYTRSDWKDTIPELDKNGEMGPILRGLITPRKAAAKTP